MFYQNFTNKNKTDTLSVRLGGEERTEQFSFCFFADPQTVIYHFNSGRSEGADYYFPIGLNAFRCILDDVYEYLLKQSGIQHHIFQTFVYFHAECNATVITHSFHKPLAGENQIIQIDRRKCRFGDFHHIG